MEKKKLSGKEKLLTIAVCVLSVCVVASTAIGVINLTTMNSLSDTVRAANGDYSDVDQENDVTIGGSYVIKETTQISDAYKAGDSSSLDDKDKETLQMASDVLKEIIKDKMTPYEKELAVYEWMTKNLSYDEGSFSVIPNTEEDCDNPYGTLKYHNAVCVGYATTFRMFMQMMDIECMVVHSSDLSHSWDLVNLDDQWYHTDIYSDEGVANYENFNMNDSMCDVNHDWNQDFFPTAEGLKYNFAVQNKKEVKDIYAIPDVLKKALEDGVGALAISFKQDIDQETGNVAENMLRNLSTCVSYEADYTDYNIDWQWQKDDKGKFFVCIFISSGDIGSGEQNPLSDEQIKNIEKAIRGAFGTDNGWSYEDYSATEGDY